MRIITLTVLLSLISLMFSAPTSGDSLFDEEGCDLFTIDNASELGDLVTIVIQESTQATNRATTETDKQLNTDGELTVEGFLQWVADFPPVISPIEDLTLTPSETFSGEGSVSTSGAFKTLVTATVVEELPNGNLVIEGVRDIQISEDTATLTIRGVIDPDDVTIDNTILSSQIADMEIDYEGTGIIAERQHDGILSRIFNFFF
jgi:flagellar L-ring protein FlgH